MSLTAAGASLTTAFTRNPLSLKWGHSEIMTSYAFKVYGFDIGRDDSSYIHFLYWILQSLLFCTEYHNFFFLFSLNVALWPVYGFLTPIMLFTVFMGFVVMVSLLPNNSWYFFLWRTGSKVWHSVAIKGALTKRKLHLILFSLCTCRPHDCSHCAHAGHMITLMQWSPGVADKRTRVWILKC